MWHASWSSVTFVKTGSMEGRLFFTINTLAHIIVNMPYTYYSVWFGMTYDVVIVYLSFPLCGYCLCWTRHSWFSYLLSEFFLWYNNVFCVAVLESRRTKQLKLTCITAPTARSPMGHLSVSCHFLSVPLWNCSVFIGLHAHTCAMFDLCILTSLYSQCANAEVAISRQMEVLVEEEIQVSLSRPEAHSLLGSYGVAPFQSKLFSAVL